MVRAKWYPGGALGMSQCWLLETSWNSREDKFYAWVSNLERLIVGFACRQSEADAIHGALVDAGHHYATDPDATAGLEYEFFGPRPVVGRPQLYSSGKENSP